jgi:hypothetical protein
MNRVPRLLHTRAPSLLRKFTVSSTRVRTMSGSNQPSASYLSNPNFEHQSRQQSPSTEPLATDAPLPLPEPIKNSNTTTIDMSTGGNTVKLDHMGPLVVNKDGTLSRITNWTQMSDIERQNTLRILGKRNQLRREALQEKEEEGEK